jgi:hypothetical protein
MFVATGNIICDMTAVIDEPQHIIKHLFSKFINLTILVTTPLPTRVIASGNRIQLLND